MSTKKDINPQLLKILVCPVTKGPLIYDKKKGELISKKASLAFPVKEGIPIMLTNAARKISKDKKK